MGERRLRSALARGVGCAGRPACIGRVPGGAGGKVFASRKGAVLDEMPGAYKDLEEVMAAQADLVRPVRRLTPLGTYKGTETRGRKKERARTWRPEEER